MTSRASQVSKFQVEPQTKRFQRIATSHENHAGNCLAMIKIFTIHIWSRFMGPRLNIATDSW